MGFKSFNFLLYGYIAIAIATRNISELDILSCRWNNSLFYSLKLIDKDPFNQVIMDSIQWWLVACSAPMAISVDVDACVNVAQLVNKYQKP